jgi:Uma2 family endonuclease
MGTTAMHTTLPFTTERELQRWLREVLPKQGCWSEEDYLWLTEQTNRLVEYADGHIEVLPMPTTRHQAILKFLFWAFSAFVESRGGTVFFAGIRLRIRQGKIREPDLLLLKDTNDTRKQDRFWTGADLTLEVVSKDKPWRDLIDKRHDYAEGKVPEYWIVDPKDETITVLTLTGTTYAEQGVFRRSDIVTSVILPGFSMSVDAVFDVK